MIVTAMLGENVVQGKMGKISQGKMNQTTYGEISVRFEKQTDAQLFMHAQAVSDCTRYFLNWCDIYLVSKVVHGNQLDNHCNYSHIHSHLNYYQSSTSKHTAPFPI